LRIQPPLPSLFPYTTLFRSRVLTLSFVMAVMSVATDPAPAANPPERATPARQSFVRGFHVMPAQIVFGQLVKTTTKKTAWYKDKDRKSTRLNSSHVSISYAV